MKSNVARAGVIIGAMACTAANAGVTEKVLYSFTGGSDGAYPESPLLADLGGGAGKLRALYGTASAGGPNGDGTAFALIPQGGNKPWTLSPLWEFTGGTDGDEPFAGLYSASKRNQNASVLYGTTSGYDAGNGTVFSLTGNSLSTIWTFTGGTDGAYPFNSVVADSSGSLYVATIGGGSGGCGTVIQLTPPAQGQTAWTETTLYGFTGAADGCGPIGLIIDRQGRLFGTTDYGGSQNSYCSAGGGCGTVFELVPPAGGQTNWTEQTIWTFQGGSDGAAAYAPLTAGKNGILYGTTAYGGGETCTYYSGCGTVFALTPPAKGSIAWTEQVLAAFSPSGNSSVPAAAVIIDRDGVLYGTLTSNFDENGSVFRLSPPAPGQTVWNLETLFNFAGSRTGSVPYGPLTADAKGVLYGTTYSGGLDGEGIVFSLTGTGFVP